MGPKIGFQDLLSLNAGQKYCRMLQESILQYFLPALSYHLSLRPLFCLFFRFYCSYAIVVHLYRTRHLSAIGSESDCRSRASEFDLCPVPYFHGD